MSWLFGAARLMHVSGLVLVGWVAGVGCASASGSMEQGEPVLDQSPEVQDDPICDGSDELRLRFFYEPKFEREPAASAVLIELGHSSIGIDGKCRYWINGGWVNGKVDEHLPWRTGQLSATLQAELDDAINLRSLDRLECSGVTTSSDKTFYTIRSPYSKRSCEVGLDETEFYSVYRILNDRGAELYAAASPFDGPLHMVAVGSGWEFGAYEVPEELYSVIEPLTAESRLVSDAPSVALLRQLRDQYIADRSAPDAPYNQPDGIPLNWNAELGTVVELFLRDSVPYELSSGLWPWSDQ